MAITKNLLPKSTGEAPHVQENTWGKMEHPGQFIASMSTSGSDMSDTAKYNLLVSSVPSPWARVHLTKHAVFTSKSNADNIMSQYYSFLRSEWRGLIAAYVLYPNNFELTKPIELKPSSLDTYDGKFDIMSVYADMLFENTPFWKYAYGDKEYPTIQLLYYRGVGLIGATSPFTILFAGMNYSLAQDEHHIYWVKDGKFQDPSSKEFDKYYKEGGVCYQKDHFDNLCKLYSFLVGVQKNKRAYIDKLKEIVKSDNPTHPCDEIDEKLGQALISWAKEIKDIIGSQAAISENIPVHHKRPEGPLKTLLSIETTYYWYEQAFHTKKQNEEKIVSDGVIDRIGSLFIEGNNIAAWDAYKDAKGNTFSSLPVHFLVEKTGALFLSMPFSRLALDEVFKEDIVSIMDGTNDFVKVMAESKDSETVDVTLRAKIDGQGELVDIYNRTFTIERPVNQNRKVFVWPNFTSSQWNKYYYYSEFPINGIGEIQMVPVFDDMNNVESESFLQSSNSKDINHLVKYPDNGIGHAYEIFRTSRSLNRIMLRKTIGNQKCDLGWLIIRKEKDASDFKNHMRVIPDGGSIKRVTVGFDFGSTNSCAYYSKSTGEPEPVPFSNRRLAIVGFDNVQGEPAEKNELLFISNEEPINKNGQVKSWLHEHDEAYIKEGNLNEEIVGGVPVNETNIVVKSMDEVMIMTNAGVLHYNMKWLIEEKDNQRKTAFFKMLWIQMCADLYAGSSSVPNKLNWSYPSAMGKREIAQLKTIFTGACDASPFVLSDYTLNDRDLKAYTEAEAVCTYFLGRGNNGRLNEKNLFVGIDIGGSTSDILVLGKGKEESVGAKPKTIEAEETVATTSCCNIDFEEMSNKELRNLIRTNNWDSKCDPDELDRKELIEMIQQCSSESVTSVDYDELSNKELRTLCRERKLDSIADPDEMDRKELISFLKKHETKSAVDYDELSNKELRKLICDRQLSKNIDYDNLNRDGLIAVLKKNENTFGGTVNSSVETAATAVEQIEDYGNNVDRLYSQCSVRIAANAFFNAIIGSRSFRDCIRNFEASKETRVRVIGIEGIDSHPEQAPYYLNNIFDQLKGDKEFVSFYKYIKVHEPFVFTLPAYITGALMTYTGMLIRNTILTNKMKNVNEVRFGYFGKGGRLFEWLYFSYGVEDVNAYLNACFNVGLKQKLIHKELGTTETIRFYCNNVDDNNFAAKESSENKSEVAIGLVRPMDIAGIKSKTISNSYEDNDQNDDPTCDPSQQDIVGEVGIKRNGKLLMDIDLVGNDFYINEGNIEYPFDKMENFNAFMDVFVKFVSAETSIFPRTEQLVSQLQRACNAGQYIKIDPIYLQYKEDTTKDSYRMPVFIATTLYYMDHCLLPVVFGTKRK